MSSFGPGHRRQLAWVLLIGIVVALLAGSVAAARVDTSGPCDDRKGAACAGSTDDPIESGSVSDGFAGH